MLYRSGRVFALAQELHNIRGAGIANLPDCGRPHVKPGRILNRPGRFGDTLHLLLAEFGKISFVKGEQRWRANHEADQAEDEQ